MGRATGNTRQPYKSEKQSNLIYLGVRISANIVHCSQPWWNCCKRGITALLTVSQVPSWALTTLQALVQAKLGDKYRSICTATFGIAFFSTPHRGSSWATMGDIFAKVARATLRNPGNTFLDALKKGDLYASELTANFQQLQEKYKYLNFYETLPLKKIGLVSYLLP